MRLLILCTAGKEKTIVKSVKKRENVYTDDDDEPMPPEGASAISSVTLSMSLYLHENSSFPLPCR